MSVTGWLFSCCLFFILFFLYAPVMYSFLFVSFLFLFFFMPLLLYFEKSLFTKMTLRSYNGKDIMTQDIYPPESHKRIVNWLPCSPVQPMPLVAVALVPAPSFIRNQKPFKSPFAGQRPYSPKQQSRVLTSTKATEAHNPSTAQERNAETKIS